MTEEPGTAAPAVEPQAADQPVKQVVARYGRIAHLGLFRHDLEPSPVPGTMVVLRTPRGAELGQVLIHVEPEPGPWRILPEVLSRYVEASGPEYPISQGGRVLRVATPQDFNDQQHLDRSAQEEEAFCREQIRQVNLPMKLICVEHLLGGERIVFYFIAEQRVDFRELVRRLAVQYHTRIEMRQVGARDEARLIADYERCGRRCCCQEYLKLLRPVSMKMAKAQKATLDPTKISGRCGRLMCCLRYEDATYDELAAALPRKNTWVRTSDGTVGKVAEVQVLTQLVRLVLPDQRPLVVPNDEIAERDVPEPQAVPPPPARPAPPQVRERPLLRGEARPPAPAPSESRESLPVRPEARPPGEGGPDLEPAPAEEGDLVPAAGESRPPGGPSRQRPPWRKKRRHPEALSAPPVAPRQTGGSPGPPGNISDRPGKRRRRRRKKRRGGMPPQGPPQQPPQR